MNTRYPFALLLLSGVSLSASFCRAQGSLTPPPGPPAATMKTLDQIEARKPVQSLAAAAPYTISQSGSYYLTGNITVASGDAIIISSDDVSVDLNGFTIRSTQTGGASGAAINVPADRSRLTVRNGSIVSGTTVASGLPVKAGFLNGISSSANYIIQGLVSEVHVTGVADYGILLDVQGVVDRCTAAHCGHTGITGDDIRDCSARNCYAAGIHAKKNAPNSSGDGNTYGMHCDGNATNCIGSSHTGTGLYCLQNAANCTGQSNVGAAGLKVTGTASFCRGEHLIGGVALQAGNAIGCTVSGGTVSAPLKSLGTP